MKNNYYPIRISWDESEKEFLAEIPALEGCIAYGQTEEDALQELKIAKELWLEARAKAKLPIPKPEASIEVLRSLRSVINVSYIARAANMPEQTLIAKINRGTPLTEKQRERIGNILAVHNT